MPKARESKLGRQPRRKRTAPREMEKHPVIDNRRHPSTEEVGKLLNVSPERIREIKQMVTEMLEKKDSEVTQ